MINTKQIRNLQSRPADGVRLAGFSSNQKIRLPLLLISLHIPLGLLLYQSQTLALIHAFSAFLIGLYFALRRREGLDRVAYVAAYIIGAEALWRMARADIFWEFGKYAIAIIMIIALLRRSKWKFPIWPLLYLIFLIPACLSTVFTAGLGDAKDKLSFNMSGPFLLFISCWFFSNLQITPGKLKRLLAMIAIPLISIAVVSFFYTVTTENIAFGTESNFITSGGFGPNQVSSMLGLGVFLCLALYLLFANNLVDKFLLALLTLLFAAQSVLTFSRGGMYNALGAVIVLLFFQMRNLGNNMGRLIPLIGLLLVFLVLLFPYLDDFTGGALQNRFENTGTTGRLEIVEADFHIFLDNPILGAGVGEANELREAYFGKAVGSHTEFARVAAEHGLFGIFALIALCAGVLSRLRTEKSTVIKALAGGAVIWSTLFMMNAGMRLAAPSLMWGLSFLMFTSPLARKSLPVSGLRAPE